MTDSVSGGTAASWPVTEATMAPSYPPSGAPPAGSQRSGTPQPPATTAPSSRTRMSNSGKNASTRSRYSDATGSWKMNSGQPPRKAARTSSFRSGRALLVTTSNSPTAILSDHSGGRAAAMRANSSMPSASPRRPGSMPAARSARPAQAADPAPPAPGGPRAARRRLGRGRRPGPAGQGGPQRLAPRRERRVDDREDLLPVRGAAAGGRLPGRERDHPGGPPP